MKKLLSVGFMNSNADLMKFPVNNFTKHQLTHTIAKYRVKIVVSGVGP